MILILRDKGTFMLVNIPAETKRFIVCCLEIGDQCASSFLRAITRSKLMPQD